MYTVLLPPGVNPIAVNKYIILCIISYTETTCGNPLKKPEIHMTEFRKPQDETYLKEVALRAKT
jgi:hypothetical protein